jgi:hypothetical integral membrane protein (TIGR02206 family)
MLASTSLWLNDYSGGPFRLFGPAHLAALALFVVLALSFLPLRRPAFPRGRSLLRYTMAGVLILNELLWHVWALLNGEWTVVKMLPLHLCSLSVYLSVVVLLSRNYRVYEFLYFLGLAGSVPALLTPNLDNYGFPHVLFFQYFIGHLLIALVPLYMTLAEGFRPRWKSVGRFLVILNVYAVFVGGVDFLLGSNYLFLAHKPAGSTLMELLGPWPWYIASLDVLAVAAVLLLYAPFGVGDWWGQRGPAKCPADTLPEKVTEYGS